MPFIDMTTVWSKTKLVLYLISKHDYVSSIVISGYKWASNPLPCGVFMTKTGILMNPAVFSEPFKPKASGSCNGLLTLALWMLISTYSYNKYVKMIARCLQLAEYVVERLKELEKDWSMYWTMDSSFYIVTSCSVQET